jgi:hypothetical protein
MINHITRKSVDKYLDLINKLETHKGRKSAIRILKSYQLYVRQVTLQITPEKLPWHKVDKRGFPKVLLPWKNWILSSDPHIKQEINTLFGAVKLLKLAPCTDTRSVTAAFSGDSDFLSEFTGFCRMWRGLGKDARSLLEPLNDIPLRRTMGPNGPAVYTSMKDLSALIGTRLMIHIRDLSYSTWSNSLRSTVDS